MRGLPICVPYGSQCRLPIKGRQMLPRASPERSYMGPTASYPSKGNNYFCGLAHLGPTWVPWQIALQREITHHGLSNVGPIWGLYGPAHHMQQGYSPFTWFFPKPFFQILITNNESLEKGKQFNDKFALFHLFQ